MPTGGLSYGSPIQFGTIPLRPLGLGEIIEGSFRTFRRYPGTIFTFGLVLALFQLATSAPLLIVFNKSNVLEKLQKLVDAKVKTFPTHWTDYSDVPLSWFGWSVLALVVGSAAIYLVGSLAYSHVAGEAAIGTSVTAGEVWRLTRRQLWRGIGMIVLLILILGLVGLAFALVAGMASLLPPVGGALALLTFLASYVVIAIMSIRFILSPAVLALEDVGPLVALRRSFRLVRGSSWRVLGYLIVAYLITAVISFAVSIPFNLIGSLGNGFSVGGSTTDSLLQVSTFSMFMQLLGQVVAAAVTLPYLYIFLAYLYTDLRMRRENLASVLAVAAEKRNR
jgi:hypothetical protein